MLFPFQSLAFIGDIGGGEIILVFLVVLMLFGGEKMPELARGVGKAIREIKKATSGVEDEIKRAMAEPPPPRPKQVPLPSVPPTYTPPPAVATVEPEPGLPTTPLPPSDRTNGPSSAQS